MDLSLYKDESQLEKKSPAKRKATSNSKTTKKKSGRKIIKSKTIVKRKDKMSSGESEIDETSEEEESDEDNYVPNKAVKSKTNSPAVKKDIVSPKGKTTNVKEVNILQTFDVLLLTLFFFLIFR